MTLTPPGGPSSPGEANVSVRATFVALTLLYGSTLRSGRQDEKAEQQREPRNFVLVAPTLTRLKRQPRGLLVPSVRFRSRRGLGSRRAPKYVDGVQVAGSGLKPDEQRRLRNRAVARWLSAAGPARLGPGRRPITAELVVHNGRACAAVTADDGQVLALYPVSGSGKRRRLAKAVPLPDSCPLPPRSQVSRADSAALLTRSRESRMASSAQISRSQAVCAAAAALCAQSRDLRASS